MPTALRTAIACALLTAATVTPARADIIFYFKDPGALQPEENLLFNSSELIVTGLLVQGLTNQTSTLIDITGQETLIADGGQVSSSDSGFTWLNIAPNNPSTLFGQFEANLKVYSPPGRPPSGTVTVSVTNNAGNVETSSYDVSGGQNYFSLLALDPQLIRSILITSTVVLAGAEQIRLGGTDTGTEEENPTTPTTVPEPASLFLLGTGLLALGRRMRRTRG